ncbi:recombination protein NinG [uncultured Flavobacterium sp.]|uniref:recombination protein NinG n=1 Tax=uncultured Flavobacterium sp. TaxID=165435 RepID=UPI002591D488|nr:recombination protein NinG [uncultured Flavobacterium sp.]
MKKPKTKLCSCGCEEVILFPKLGKQWVDKKHYIHWLTTSEAGQKMVVRAARKAIENEKKAKDNEVKSWKPIVHEKKYKQKLQGLINKLARMIDLKFGFVTCIDCDKTFGEQVDGAHFHSVGGNSSTRYNLHNIHSAKSHCNKYSDKHKEGYILGLKMRYDEEYYQMVESLPFQYQYIKLGSTEIVYRLKIVRGIIRNFHLYNFGSSIEARNEFNKIIGIYN